MFYVYEWFIKDSSVVFYVGKGCRDRYKVLKHNKAFNLFLKLFDCESRIVKTFENETDAFEYEYERVKELKKIGQCQCNIYDGGFGGNTEWWTDDLRRRYSEKNIMKSKAQRLRMKTNNPMKNKDIAEKTNGQKRRKVTIGNTTYKSFKEAEETLGISYSNIITWGKHGKTPSGETCLIEPQKQYRVNAHGNQKPSRGNADNSTTEGSTTNG